jgi:membrane-associated protease RseP (regulator of RpoE activity)
MKKTRILPTLLGTFLATLLLGPGSTPSAQAEDWTNTPAADAWHGFGLNIDGRKEKDEKTGMVYYIFYDPPEVWSIERGSPAHRAGIQRGDRLIEINGHPFTSQEAGRLFPNLEPGDRVVITYERDGVEKKTDWTVGSRDRKGSGDWTVRDGEHLRYAGNHWGADYEVRGSEEVVVMVNRDRQEVLIIGNSMSVRVRTEGP